MNSKPPKLELKVNELAGIMELFLEGKEVACGVYEVKKGQRIFIDQFEVDANLRGGGIGGQGVELIKEYFKKRGFKKISLVASQGTPDPYDKTPYDFWVGKCGFRDTRRNGVVEFMLQA